MLRSKSAPAPALSAQNRAVLGLIHLGTATPAADAVLFGRAPVVDRVVQLCSSAAPDRAALTEALAALREHIAQCKETPVEHCAVGDVLEKQMIEHISFCTAQAYRAEHLLAEASASAVKTTAEGFVKFRARDWGRRADKGTWARIQDGKLTVQRAPRGLLSSAYEAELEAFCAQYGLDWAGIHCGDRVVVDAVEVSHA